MKLSVVIPVYNEVTIVDKFWEHFQQAPITRCDGIDAVEVILVDDGSTDGTLDRLRELARREINFGEGINTVVALMNNERNYGKGYSVARGINQSSGDIILIQDADLEYSVYDYPSLLEPILSDDADAVFGSRFVGHPRRVLYFWHSVVNKLLTTLSNAVNDISLTDMETCYKACRGDLLRSLRLTSRRFGVEPELTSRLSRSRARLFEVPISYRGRTYDEGKKIGLSDGVSALFHIFRFGLVDTEPFKPGEHQTLHALESGARGLYFPTLQRALDAIPKSNPPPRLLEIGCGIGSLTSLLLQRGHVTAADLSADYLDKTRERYRHASNIRYQIWDATTPYPDSNERFDIVVAFNLLEHLQDHENALKIWSGLLTEHGRLLLYVPNLPRLYSGLDEAVGHHRRYDQDRLETVLSAAGLQIETQFYANALGIAGWYVRGKWFRETSLPAKQIRLYLRTRKLLGPVERLINRYSGLSIAVIARPEQGRGSQPASSVAG